MAMAIMSVAKRHANGDQSDACAMSIAAPRQSRARALACNETRPLTFNVPPSVPYGNPHGASTGRKKKKKKKEEEGKKTVERSGNSGTVVKILNLGGCNILKSRVKDA